MTTQLTTPAILNPIEDVTDIRIQNLDKAVEIFREVIFDFLSQEKISYEQANFMSQLMTEVYNEKKSEYFLTHRLDNLFNELDCKVNTVFENHSIHNTRQSHEFFNGGLYISNSVKHSI